MTQTAKVYADALYSLAAEEHASEEILRQLEILDEIFRQEPAFLPLLAAPSLPKEERCSILDHCLQARVHPYVLSFLKLLTERDHIRQFEGCCRQYRICYNEDHGILPVQAVTAVALTPALASRLQAKLESLTGKTVELTNRIDPDCLGGIRLDMDGVRLDDTLRHRLDQLRQTLKQTVL